MLAVWRTVGEGVIWGAAFMTALLALWKFPVGPLWKAGWRKGITELGKMMDTRIDTALKPVRSDITYIKSELEANGGSTVKDVSIQTRDRLDDMSSQLEELIVTRRHPPDDIDGTPI